MAKSREASARRIAAAAWEDEELEGTRAERAAFAAALARWALERPEASDSDVRAEARRRAAGLSGRGAPDRVRIVEEEPAAEPPRARRAAVKRRAAGPVKREAAERIFEISVGGRTARVRAEWLMGAGEGEKSACAAGRAAAARAAADWGGAEGPFEGRPACVQARLEASLRTLLAGRGLDLGRLDPRSGIGAVGARLEAALEAAAQDCLRGEAARAARSAGATDRWHKAFPQARSLRRRLRLFVGPTNSGKTHAAMDLLAARGGTYAAPLRLMALEGRNRFESERGLACSLATGEETEESPGAALLSCTVEMLPLDRRVPLAVIDEIQMVSDPERGWAWTDAVLGCPAEELVMCGSEDAVPWIESCARTTGEDLAIERFARKAPLRALAEPARIRDLEPGDAIVAFSKPAALELLAAARAAGWKAAAIYGAMGPTARRLQAEAFRSGAADILVATDAIGMGLNLPCRRVLFAATEKFDGERIRPLTASEIRQIAGRAGRYGMREEGWAGVMAGGDPSVVAEALEDRPAAPADRRPWVLPPAKALIAAADVLGTDSLAKTLRFVLAEAFDPKGPFRPAKAEGALALAAVLDGGGLSFEDRCRCLGAPLDARSAFGAKLAVEWTRRQASGREVPAPRLDPTPREDPRGRLDEAERVSAAAGLYLWMGERFPLSYPFLESARAARNAAEEAIVSALADPKMGS